MSESTVKPAPTEEATEDSREEQIRGELKSAGYGAGEIQSIVREAKAAVKANPARSDAADDVFRAAFERKHRGG